jgi:outer membrane receptor protein involved in Fe transport
MFQRKVLVSAIIAASASTSSHAQIEEIIVTATKRSASTQDIPVAVNALNESSLEQLGITDFNDYLIQMPGVTAGGGGPGQNTIYIRGVASTTPNLTTAGVAGLAPNVALYLDEQPLSQPGRNLDVYAADLSRVEVLKGPQGTLFGASSQAGTVRLITNKPNPSGFEGKMKFGASSTNGGEPSNNVEAMINFPVMDALTIRGVVYVDNQGGYIDNVAGTRSVQEGAGIQSASNLDAVTFIDADNSSRVEDDFNEVTYSGARASALWEINDEWELLVGAAQQTIDSEGSFFVDPELDDLEIQRFEQDTLEDEFDNYNWTLTGRMAALDVVYTGAFTSRESEQRVDYTDYLFVGQYIPYYICDRTVAYDTGGYTAAAIANGTCQAPNLFVKSSVKSEFITHELRFSTDQSNSLRATFGVFYSDSELKEVADFTYPGSELTLSDGGYNGLAPDLIGYGPMVSLPDSSASAKGIWPEGVMFRNDVLRTDKQTAFFGEVTFDFNEQFSVTAGLRHYDVEVDLKGSATGAFNTASRGQDTVSTGSDARNLDLLFSDATPGSVDKAISDGTIGKLTASWRPTDSALFYTSWSEGFRPGILNRPGGSTDGTYTVPYDVDTDTVTNYEFGWKTDLLDGSLRFNGSLFLIEADNLQSSVFNPDISNLFFASNAANAEIKGIEGDFIWEPSSVAGLSLSGGFSVLDTEIVDVLVPTDQVTKGNSLAFAPELQLNLQARYEWDLSSGNIGHVMPHISYSDESYTDIININRHQLNSWAMLGITAGISNNEWSAEFYIDNLTDERAEISGNTNFDKVRVTVSRPRTSGVRISYKF